MSAHVCTDFGDAVPCRECQAAAELAALRAQVEALRVDKEGAMETTEKWARRAEAAGAEAEKLRGEVELARCLGEGFCASCGSCGIAP